MRYLLDTHTFLWFVLGDARLSITACGELAKPENDLVLSAAGCREIAIKISTGKYSIPGDFSSFILGQLAQNEIDYLPIGVPELECLSTLPFHHRDPFDRLIVSQAITHHLPLISADEVIDAYPVQRIWQ